MTPAIGEALRAAQDRFKAESDSPGLDAHLLLCKVLNVGRAYLLAYPEQTLTDEQAEHFDALVERAATGEPIAYILGRRAFYDREFIVTPDVLIPRPETELLLERALQYMNRHPDAHVVDVGTGSGALAVTLAAHAPQATLYATDVSPAALMIARKNAALNEVEKRIEFFEGDLLTPLIVRGLQVDVVLANLPYIATDELATLAVSRFEPSLALDGGQDGLALVRRLFEQLGAATLGCKMALLEIGADQGQAAFALGHQLLQPTDASLHQDYAGLDRIVELRFDERRG
jgi:release factor glutamine methyltransferase